MAFIYEEFDYPEGMFTDKQDDSKKRQGAAGGKVYSRFVKNKGTLNKYQHLMIRDMAYFEAIFNEMLNDKKAKVETLEGLKKGREAFENESSNIFPQKPLKSFGLRENVKRAEEQKEKEHQKQKSSGTSKLKTQIFKCS